ncbi:phospholipid scramblase 1-like [Hyla sarda]|uniref:phospholipid scramblase 1-like n=1 Tax=Hyla sarda TaxID=327740 RepID=UPI0024C3C92A|nr:phospholipid scramblase 1-like [Hyla sarda]
MAASPLVPPGLQELIPVSRFYVNQTWSSVYQRYCTYDLLGPDGNLVYQAREKRKWCGPPMDVRVQNIQGCNVLTLYKPAVLFSWKSKLQVIDASDRLLGYIEKNFSFSSASFNILNPLNQICLKVEGPGWGEGFMSDRVFKVLSADKSAMVSHITRVWKGIGKEMFSREDNFVVQFPPNMEVSMKAILLCCTLLIDLLKHKRQRNQSRSS